MKFTIVRKSENTNSFGLRGYWAVADTGTVYSFATSDSSMERFDEIEHPAPERLGELLRVEGKVDDPKALIKAFKRSEKARKAH